MFKITTAKGFHVELPNGYTISVQFGPSNYCDNKNASDMKEEWYLVQRGRAKLFDIECPNAEIAVWATNEPDSDYLRLDGSSPDGMMGWQTSQDFVRVLLEVSLLPRPRPLGEVEQGEK